MKWYDWFNSSTLHHFSPYTASLPSNSHHEDFIFLVGDPKLNLHLPLFLGRGTTQHIHFGSYLKLNISKIWLAWRVSGCSCSQKMIPFPNYCFVLYMIDPNFTYGNIVTKSTTVDSTWCFQSSCNHGTFSRQLLGNTKCPVPIY